VSRLLLREIKCSPRSAFQRNSKSVAAKISKNPGNRSARQTQVLRASNHTEKRVLNASGRMICDYTLRV